MVVAATKVAGIVANRAPTCYWLHHWPQPSRWWFHVPAPGEGRHLWPVRVSVAFHRVSVEGRKRVKVPSIRYWLRCRHPPCSACGNKVWWAYINRLETRDGWMVNFQMWGLGHYIIGGSKLGQGSVHSLLIRSTYPFVFPPTRHDTSAADAAVASAGRKGATHLRVSLHQKPRGFSEYLYVPSRYPVYPLPTHWWPTSGI